MHYYEASGFIYFSLFIDDTQISFGRMIVLSNALREITSRIKLMAWSKSISMYRSASYVIEILVLGEVTFIMINGKQIMVRNGEVGLMVGEINILLDITPKTMVVN